MLKLKQKIREIFGKNWGNFENLWENLNVGKLWIKFVQILQKTYSW